MGYDDEIVIPIRMKADMTDVEKEVYDSAWKLKEFIASLKTGMESVSDETRKITFETTIKEIADMTKGMSEMLNKSVEANKAAAELSQQYRQAKMQANRTGAESDVKKASELKQQWDAAKASVIDYENQLNDANSRVESHIKELRKIAYLSVRPKATMEDAERIVSGVNNINTASEKVVRTWDRAKGLSDEIRAKAEKYHVALEAIAELDEKVQRGERINQWAIDAVKKEILEAEQRETEEKKRQLEVERELNAQLKERKAEIQGQIRAEQETAKQAKLTTSQYYYRLRSMKMVNRYLQMINQSMDNFGKKSIITATNITKNYLKLATGFGVLKKGLSWLISGFGKLAGKIGSVTGELRKSNKMVKKATVAHKDFGKSMGVNIKLILRYVFGIRSLFVLFNRLRSAMVEGLGILAKNFDEVNEDMSSLLTSFVRMKNAIAGAVQPIVTIVVPVFERLSEVVANASVNIASFFASFTGQEYVYKAMRVQQDYAESLDKTKKSAKEAKGQLQSYDKLLNVTTKDDKDKDDDGTAGMFEKVPVNKKVKDLADKIKNLLKDFFKPLKNAWDKEGKFVIDSWKYALGEIWKLIKDIGRDFLRVWHEPETQRIFENILHVLGDIGLIVGHLARNFREAWNENENGYRILRAIRDIILIISEGLREAADYTVKWADALSFKPLLNAIREVLETQIVPAVQKIVDLLVYLYEKVILELVRYLIEELLPIVTHIFGNIVESIGNIADNIQDALEEGKKGEKIVKAIEDIITVVANGILDCSEYTAEWSKEIDFNPLFEEMLNLLNDIKNAVQKITDLFGYLYKKIFLKIVQDFIESGLPKLERILGNIIKTIGNISDNLHKALEENDRGTRLLEHTEDLINVIADAIEDCSEKTAKWSENLDFGPLLDAIDSFLVKAQPAIQFISNTLSNLWTNVLLPFWEYLIEQGLPKLLDTLGEISDKIDWEKLKENVDAFLASFEKFLEKSWETLVIILGDIGSAIANFVNSESFDHLVDTLIKWMDNADPESMAKGIEHLVKQFAMLRVGLAFVSYAGQLREFVMTLVNWHNNKAMTATVAETASNIEKLNQSLDDLPNKLRNTATEAKAAETAVENIGTGTELASATIGTASIASVASIALISVAIVTLWKTNEDFRNNVKGLWQDIKDAFDTYSQKIVDNLNSLGLNITKLSDLWVKFCDFIEPTISRTLEGISHVIESFMQAISGVVSVISGIVNVIIGIFDAFVNKDLTRLKEGSVQIVDGIKDGFLGATGIMQSSTTIMRQSVDGNIREMALNSALEVTGMKDKISESMGLLTGNVDSDMSQIKDSVNDGADAFNSLQSNLESTATQYNLTAEQSQVLNDAFMSNKTNTEALNGSFTELDTTMGTTSANVSTNIGTMSGNIDTGMATSVESVAVASTNMQGEFDKLTEKASSTPTDMSAGFEQGWNSSIGADGAIWIASIISPTFGNILSWILDFLGIHSPSTVFEDIGINIIEGLKLGLEELWPDIPDFFDTNLSDLLDSIGEMWDDFTDIGEYLIDGLLDGLQNAWGDVVDWIFEVCESLIDDIKNFFGIASPSKVMIAIGEFLSDGMAIGIKNDSKEAISNMNDMADDILSEADRIVQDTPEDIQLNFTLTESLDTLYEMVEQARTLETVFNSINAITTSINTSAIKTPDIVSGKVLPTEINKITAKSSNGSSAISSDEMYNIINDAVYSAIKSAYDKGMLTDGDTIIQADGREIARAVKRENDIYRRSTGRSMFNV